MTDFAMNQGESVTAEAGFMVYMRGSIRTGTKTRKGGLFKASKSSVLGGESFSANEFAAREDGCRLGVTGNVLDGIEMIRVDGEYIVQSGSYVASTGAVTLATQRQGFITVIFESNLLMPKTAGSGDMSVDGGGGIRNGQLGDGKRVILGNHQMGTGPPRPSTTSESTETQRRRCSAVRPRDRDDRTWDRLLPDEEPYGIRRSALPVHAQAGRRGGGPAGRVPSVAASPGSRKRSGMERWRRRLHHPKPPARPPRPGDPPPPE